MKRLVYTDPVHFWPEQMACLIKTINRAKEEEGAKYIEAMHSTVTVRDSNESYTLNHINQLFSN